MSQIGSKLAASVRQAKQQATEKEACKENEVKQSKTITTPIEEEQPFAPLPSRRIWPD